MGAIDGAFAGPAEPSVPAGLDPLGVASSGWGIILPCGVIGEVG